MSPAVAGDLREAYDFLRTVEGRLRLIHNRNISELPESRTDLEKLARRLIGESTDPAAAVASFLAEADRLMRRSRAASEQIVLAQATAPCDHASTPTNVREDRPDDACTQDPSARAVDDSRQHGGFVSTGMTWRIGLGPVFAYEWIASARRWQGYALRSCFVLLLSAALVTVWIGLRVPSALSFKAMAYLGQSFFLGLTGTQLALVLLAAPAATAGAICLDRAGHARAHALDRPFGRRDRAG